MTWPTDEAREAVRQALTMTVEDVHVVIVDRDGTTSGATSVGIDAEGFADAVLAALAPHVAALVRAERAAALREAATEVNRLRGALTNARAKAADNLASGERIARDVMAERDAMAARLAKVEALAERWREVGLVCECGHGLDQHNGLGCYARHSYAPLVTCECSETDDRHEEEFAVRDLRDALTEERADG